jgi:ribulose-phosphate 3-epimerase
MKIIPTIFASNKKEFTERFNKLVRVSRNLQIDFMDSKFIKGKSIEIKEVPDLKSYKNNFEAHLMVKSPEKYIEELKEKGFKKVIFHVEAATNIEKTIEKIKSLQMVPYLAINPETPTEKAFPYLSKIKGILFMGVHPGKEHQKLIPETLKKIQQLKNVNKSVRIQVDGGVNEKTAPKLKQAGVDYINSGSFISDSENPKHAFNKLNSLIRKC